MSSRQIRVRENKINIHPAMGLECIINTLLLNKFGIAPEDVTLGKLFSRIAWAKTIMYISPPCLGPPLS